MDWEKKVQIGLGIAALIFVIFWIYHIVECLRRPDFSIFDKVFWFILLLIPALGLIMYRGIGNEFYKKNRKDGVVRFSVPRPDKCDAKDTRQ